MFSTLDEAVEQSASSLISDSDEVEKTTTEEITPDAEQEAPSTDDNQKETDWKFTSVDPKTLPPELQEVYHNLNKGFTQNMQKKSEEIKAMQKELEELRSKVQPQEQVVSENVDFSQMTPDELAQYIQHKTVEQAKLDMKVERENEYIESAEKEFFTIDDRLNPNSPTYDKFFTSAIVDSLAELRFQHEQENGTIIGFDFKGGTKQLIEEFDSQMAEKYKKFISQKQADAKQNSQKLAKTNQRSGTVVSSKQTKMSLDDAINSAVEKAGF